MAAHKRPFNEGKRHFKKSKKPKTGASDGSNEEVLLKDVRALLRDVQLSNVTLEQELEQEQGRDTKLPEQWAEIELRVTDLASTGDGLGERDGQIYVVPFTAPGDVVTARIVRHVEDEKYSLTDFVTLVSPSEHRSVTPQCPYFTQCSGCQFQHLPYTHQLAHKRRIIEKAYLSFSGLDPSALPPVGETIRSPLEYGYRTKLTPHFDGPPGGRRDRRHGEKVSWKEVPPIGFMKKGTRKTMDIEDCPIGTEAVRMGLKRERKRVSESIQQYQRGATLLLRENTERVAKPDRSPEHTNGSNGDAKPANGESSGASGNVVMEDKGDHLDLKTCITDHKATSTEYIDAYRLDNPAGAFFQNNNSILPLITKYIRDNILGPEPTPSPDGSQNDKQQHGSNKVENLIDAYCGSGFFTITLSPIFAHSVGIDISGQSIEFATKNAKLNNLAPESVKFIAGDARDLFASIPRSFIPSETAVVIDPPRKGCDEGFIRQLMQFAPQRICYVSCNVHTQARDVGWLVGGLTDHEGLRGSGMYEVESLRGFDFFPQTGHVEGVAILKKKGGESESANVGGSDADAGVLEG